MQLSRLLPLVAVAALTLAAFLLWRALQRYSLEEIRQAIAAISLGHLLLAGAFAAGSYTTLTGVDYLAVRYAGHRLPYRQTALASFVALSLGHSIGFAALSSGAVRYRFYSRFGLGVAEVGQVILFCGLTVGIGLAALGGIAFLMRPDLAGEVAGLGHGAARAASALCFAAVGLYLLLAWRVCRPLRIRRWHIALPALPLALGQVLLGTLNFTFVAACLNQLLAGGAAGYFTVAATYVIGTVATLVAHVPGGLGVLEAVVLSLLPGAAAVGGLVAFRAVYFLTPLCIGVLLFTACELLRRRHGTA